MIPATANSDEPPVVVRSSRPLPYCELEHVGQGLYIFGVSRPKGIVGKHHQVIHVDGFGVLRDRAIAAPSDFTGRSNENFVEHYGRNVRGAVVTYLIDPGAATAWILPDPLGAGIVFYFQNDEIFAASSSIRALASTLKTLSIVLHPSQPFLAELLAQDSGCFVSSSYEQGGGTVDPHLS